MNSAVTPSTLHKVDGAEAYQARDLLKNGSAVTIRSIKSSDKPILQVGMRHLSNQARFFRFLTQKKELSDSELKYFTEIDFFHHVGLLACVVEGDKEIPAGVGRYILINDPTSNNTSMRADPATAEIAFAVDEKYQGLGIGKMLLKHLTHIARAEGITKFMALVHPQNEAMLRVFEHCGMPMHRTLGSLGTLEITLDLQ